MNRREIIAAGLATPVALSLPASAEGRWYTITTMKRHYSYSPEAEANPHFPMATTFVREMVQAGGIVVFTGMPYWNDRFDFRDPYVRITTGKKVFNVLTGDTDEDGLLLDIFEGNDSVLTCGIGSTHGADWKAFEDRYFVRIPSLTWDKPKDRAVRAKFGDQISPDIRVFMDAIDVMKKAEAASV